jgi:hypothetical protein
MLLVFTLVLALGAMVAVAFISAQAHRANSEAMTASFFITLVAGHLILNVLRICFNSCLAPSVGMRVTNEEDGDEEVGCCASFFLSSDCIQIMKDIILVQEVIENLQAKKSAHDKSELTKSPID